MKTFLRREFGLGLLSAGLGCVLWAMVAVSFRGVNVWPVWAFMLVCFAIINGAYLSVKQ